MKGCYTSEEAKTNLSRKTNTLRNTRNFSSDCRHFLVKSKPEWRKWQTSFQCASLVCASYRNKTI